MKIKVENYTKIISGECVLNNINMSLESGNIYGLIGKNGSGKTMLLRAICGLIHSTSGEVIIDDDVIGKTISFARDVGALIESPGFLPQYSAYKNLEILSKIRGKISKEEIRQILTYVGLEPESKKKYRKFSLGMKQKLGIAAAFMENPGLILLDEPTNALDEKSHELFINLLLESKKRNALILITSHDRLELERCCNVIFHMDGGEIIETVHLGGTDEKI